jgi:hypothetical protein
VPAIITPGTNQKKASWSMLAKRMPPAWSSAAMSQAMAKTATKV